MSSTPLPDSVIEKIHGNSVRLTRIETLLEGVDEKLDMHFKLFHDHTRDDIVNFEMCRSGLAAIEAQLTAHLHNTEAIQARLQSVEAESKVATRDIGNIKIELMKLIAWGSGAVAVVLMVWSFVKVKLITLLGL